MNGKNVDWTFDWRADRDVYEAGLKLAEAKATVERMVGELDAMMKDLQNESPVAFNLPQRLRAFKAALATVEGAASTVGLFHDMVRNDLGQIVSAVTAVNRSAECAYDEMHAYGAPSECGAAIEANRGSAVVSVLRERGMDADRLLDAVGGRTSEKYAAQSLWLD